MKTLVAVLILSLPALAQPGQWQTPGEIRTPTGTWQTPASEWQVPKDLQVPKGVQIVKEKSRVRLRMAADTLFAYDKSNLTPAAEGILQKLGPTLQKFGKSSLMTIEGHTDSNGSDEYNQKLSEARAATVHNWLKAHHYIPGTSVTVGYGEQKPVAPNTDAKGRQKNRRVEIVVEESR